jgi:hypothetical protein
MTVDLRHLRQSSYVKGGLAAFYLWVDADQEICRSCKKDSAAADSVCPDKL